MDGVATAVWDGRHGLRMAVIVPALLFASGAWGQQGLSPATAPKPTCPARHCIEAPSQASSPAQRSAVSGTGPDLPLRSACRPLESSRSLAQSQPSTVPRSDDSDFLIAAPRFSVDDRGQITFELSSRASSRRSALTSLQEMQKIYEPMIRPPANGSQRPAKEGNDDYVCERAFPERVARAAVAGELPNMLGIVTHGPAQTSDRLAQRQWCSATVVSSRSFVTAAHCVDHQLFSPKLAAQDGMSDVLVKVSDGPIRGASCQVPEGYRAVALETRRARCNRRDHGCDLDVAVCTLSADLTGDGLGKPHPMRWIDQDAGGNEKFRVLPPVKRAGVRANDVHIAGYGDGNNGQLTLCKAKVRLVDVAAGYCPQPVKEAFGVAQEPGGASGAPGDSGGGVFIETKEGLALVGVITQLNFQARSTYFVDFGDPEVCNFLRDAMERAEGLQARARINCPEPIRPIKGPSTGP